MEIEKILKQLVEIPSVTSDTEACKEAVQFIKNIVEKEGLKTKIFEKNNVQSLLVAKEIKNKYEVILNGHLDVVPASKDQFKVRIEEKDGKRIMFGRGTSDMKGGVVTSLVAFLECIEEGCNTDMALLFTTDEETGGFDGAAFAMEKGITADVMFTPDGGDDWSIVTDEKGVFHIKFEATGVSAHGSRTWLGDNAVEKLIKTFNRIDKQFNEKWGKATKKDNWKPTLNLGALNGGDAANKIPNKATMLIDIRYPSPVTQEDLEGVIKSSIQKGVTWKAISTGAPLSTSSKNKYMKKWIKLISNPILEKESGASDARFFAEKGIPVIITKSRGAEPHIDGEWTDLDDLEVFKNKTKEWLKSI
jgi:succinyl-diaminopimelate desuccinylase